MIGALSGGAGESAVYKCTLVSVCACSCACVNENVREKECYEEMDERNEIDIIYLFVALGVDSVVLRNRITHWYMDGKHWYVNICDQHGIEFPREECRPAFNCDIFQLRGAVATHSSSVGAPAFFSEMRRPPPRCFPLALVLSAGRRSVI